MPDVAVHAVVPEVETGTGGSIRTLGVDHELVCIAVFIQPGCSGQIVRPVFPIPGQFLCCLLGEIKIFLRFIWHCVPPFMFRGKQKSERPFQVTRLWNLWYFNRILRRIFLPSQVDGQMSDFPPAARSVLQAGRGTHRCCPVPVPPQPCRCSRAVS